MEVSFLSGRDAVFEKAVAILGADAVR
jgi:hypothetical protein